MAALFDVSLWAAETENQKIAQSLLRAFEILRGIHRPENIVGWNLPVKRIGKTLESGLADRRVNVLLFH